MDLAEMLHRDQLDTPLSFSPAEHHLSASCIMDWRVYLRVRVIFPGYSHAQLLF